MKFITVTGEGGEHHWIPEDRGRAVDILGAVARKLGFKTHVKYNLMCVANPDEVERRLKAL